MKNLFTILLSLLCVSAFGYGSQTGSYGSVGNHVASSDTASTSTNLYPAIPEIDFAPNQPIRIWDGTNSFVTNFPASTTFGFNEVQQMFPWRTNGAIWTGGLIRFAAGEYDFTTPIVITNNWTIEGAGHLSTVWVYTGTTNGYTVSAMTNAAGQSDQYVRLAKILDMSLVRIPTNQWIAGSEFSGGDPGPNVNIKGITIKAATNCCAVILSSFANSFIFDDLGIGVTNYLNALHGGYRIGYLDALDVSGPQGLIGMWIGGAGRHTMQKCDFGGLADSVVLDVNGWITVEDCVFHVAGQFAAGKTNMYPTNAAAAFLGDGFHIYNIGNFHSVLENNFYDEANYDVDNTVNINYSMNAMEQTVTHPMLDLIETGLIIYDLPDVTTYFGFGNGATLPTPNGGIVLNGAIASDYNAGSSPSFNTDGSGNVIAVSYTGSGSGLTGITSNHVVSINPSQLYPITSNSIPVAVTVGASAFNFTNKTTSILNFYVSGGAATVSVSKNGVSVAGSLAGLDYSGTVLPNDYITLTYSVGTPSLLTNKFW